MAGIIAVLAAVAVAVVLIATVDSAKPKSDEDQIRALVTKAEAANGSDITAYRGLWCAKMQHIIDEVTQSHPDMKLPERSKPHGQITVKSIRVNGDRATATITGTVNGRTRDGQMTFAKEGGQWKLCL